MSDNFTHEHGLIEEITSKGWFANPAGRQGYEVIVLEKVGDGGTRFYAMLKPGETLRFSERMFGRFTARAVDIRHARSFPVQGEFQARERGRKVYLRANVRYRVVNARVVAIEAVDPLAELRDKVIASLTRELARFAEAEIAPGLIEKVIRGVGHVEHLGLQVDDAEVLEYRSDTRITNQVLEVENLDHTTTVSGTRQQAELEAQARQHREELARRQEAHEAINMTSLNVLLHEHPEMAPAVFAAFTEREQRLLDARMNVLGPAIAAYQRQKLERDEDIDPRDIVRIMEEAIRPPTSLQLTGGAEQPARITWGGDEAQSPLPAEPRIIFDDDDAPDDAADSPPRIKFG